MRRFVVLRLCTGISDLLLLAGAVSYAARFPAALVEQLVFPSVAVGIGVIAVIMRRQGGLGAGMNLRHLLSLAVFWALSTCITLGGLYDLPEITDWRTVYAVHLEPFYRVLHLALVGFLVFWTFTKRPGRSKAEMGLVSVLVYSAANGYFFHLHGDRFALILGLCLATLSLHLLERRTAGIASQLPPTAVPAFFFLGWGLIATVFAPYVHTSLTVWIRLATWVFAFLLITWIARRQAQLERLFAVMLCLFILIAVAGLVGIVGYAERLGWSNAVRTRLFVRELHANGVGALMAAGVVFLAGMWPRRQSLQRRLLQVTGVLAMLLCGLFTYSRGGGLGLFAGLIVLLLLRRKGGRITSRRSPLVMIALAALPLLFIVISSTIRISEDESQSRIEIWKVVVNVIQKRPVAGVGMGNHLIPHFAQSESGARPWNQRDTLSMVRQIGWHSHNLFLEIGEALGLVGLLLFGVLLVRGATFIKTVNRHSEAQSLMIFQASCAAVVSLLASHMVGLSLSAFTLLPACFWVFWGLMIAAGNNHATEHDLEHPNATGSRRLRGGLTLWLALSCLLVTPLFVVRPLVVEHLLRSTKDKTRYSNDADVQRAMRSAARLDPLRAEIYAMLGTVSSPEHALACYQKAARLRPFHVPYQTKLGWLNWAAGNFEDAVASFRNATVLDRYGIEEGEHWSDLALAYAAAGRKAEAIEAFSEAALLDPQSLAPPDWQRSMGEICLDAVYTLYYENHTVDPVLWNRLMRHASLSGPSPERIPFVPGSEFCLRDVLDHLRERATRARQPEQTRGILFAVAEVLLRWRLYDELDQVLGELAALAADHAPSQAKRLKILGVSLRSRGRLKDAESAFSRAPEYVNHPELHHQLGLTRLRHGNSADGIRALEEAATSFDPSLLHDPSWRRYWKDLANAYRDAGRLDDALAAYDIAQFLSYPVPAYVNARLEIAEAYRDRGNVSREFEIYRGTLETLAALRKSRATVSPLLRKLALAVSASLRAQRVTAEEYRGIVDSLVTPYPDLREEFLRHIAANETFLGLRD